MRRIIPFIVIMILLTGLVTPSFVQADVATPKKQIKLGITANEVFCKENLVKVFKDNGKPRCVNPSSVDKLLELGYAVKVDEKSLQEIVDKPKRTVGTITKVAIAKQTLDIGKLDTSGKVDFYYYIFEICAGEQPIRAPAVLVTSDSEGRYVKLADTINEQMCQTNSVKIKARNTDTISVILDNEGGVTKKITDMETKVAELKGQLNSAKLKLSTLIQEEPKPDNYQERSNRLSEQIVQLRTELNMVKGDLNRYLFALNVTPQIKKDDLVLKSFAGSPLEGIQVNKLAVTEQIQGVGFDVVFEMCAGNQLIRVPMVAVSSDMESKTVKLADKIIANSCQMSGTKIQATDSDSIVVSTGETGEKSARVSELEKKVSELQTALQAEKEKMRELTHLAPRPQDFDNKAIEIGEKIAELRSEINYTKLRIFNILHMVYQ